MKTFFTALLMATSFFITGCDGLGKPISIHKAALIGDMEAIREHIKLGSDLDEKDSFGSTPLIIAATFGQTEVAMALIKAGADLNMKNADGSTALITAAFLCRTEIVEALLAEGVDKNVTNKVGSTALESVVAPFDYVKDVYDNLGKALGPLGLNLDYEHIKKTRPIIAEMLQNDSSG